jgi:hypothetical protein
VIGLGVCLAVFRLFFLFGAPVTGRVIAADTGAPVADAEVTAMWEIYDGVLHVQRRLPLRYMTARTDADGRFKIPWWGPWPRFPPWGRIDPQHSPTITVTHPQFQKMKLGNDWERRSTGWILRSDRDGEDIALTRYPPPRPSAR